MYRINAFSIALVMIAFAGQAQTVVNRDTHDILRGTITRDGDRWIERDASGRLLGWTTATGRHYNQNGLFTGSSTVRH
jgi:YD repeat-containing protein